MCWITVHSVESSLLVSKDLHFSFRTKWILSTWGTLLLDLVYFHKGLSLFRSFCGSFKFFCGGDARVSGQSLACFKYMFYLSLHSALPLDVLSLPCISEEMQGQWQAMQSFLTVGGCQNTDMGYKVKWPQENQRSFGKKRIFQISLKIDLSWFDWNGDYN